MNFLIDGGLLFMPGDNSLQLRDDPSRLATLPVPATLLLTVLVTTPRQVISRDSLMEAAWDRSGFRASGHNLNTYISVIRNALTDLDVDRNLIKTIARQGLILQADVEILETPVAPHHAPLPAELVVLPHSDSLAPVKSGNPITLRYCATVIVLMFFAALIPVLLFSGRTPHIAELNSEKIGALGRCEIYSLTSVTATEKMHLLAKVKADKHVQPCQYTSGKIWIYEQDEGAISSLSYCAQQEEKAYHCATYFIGKES